MTLKWQASTPDEMIIWSAYAAGPYSRAGLPASGRAGPYSHVGKAVVAVRLDKPKHQSLVHALHDRAGSEPDRHGYIFLADGEEESASMTWGELDRAAHAIARQLRKTCSPGDRALLVYPAGLEFIAGYLGCLLAQVAAVPVPAPRSARQERGASRLRAIIDDAHPAAILGPGAVLAMAREALGEQAANFITHEEACDAGGPAEPAGLSEIHPESLAFLQYTSGSASAPKGVMVSHANLMHNLEVSYRAFNGSPQATGLTWLPHYHDMGLMMQLQALYAGCRSVIMPAAAILQRPVRWLAAITKYQVQASGGPNFAYALCARSVREQDKQALDLSHWKVAYNAAEPIHPETLESFSRAFACCGFSPDAMMPGYGLAENTLVVSCADIGAGAHECHVDTAALRAGRVSKVDAQAPASTRLISSGKVRGGQEVLIVDPRSNAPCAVNTIGEIWIRGSSVAVGYWHNQALSREVFAAQPAHRQGAYLRTGDLGFFDGGELVITGRLKDLIIVRGLNHYPQDIEKTAGEAHPALAESGGAAFSVEAGEQERLVVVHELSRSHRDADVNEVAQAVRQAIAECHELALHTLVLLKPGHLPRTTSGKVRRSACREAYLNGTLEEVGRWDVPAADHDAPGPVGDILAPNGPQAESVALTAENIALVLTRLLAEAAHCPADEIDPAEPFVRYGLDSAAAVSLAEAIRAELDLSDSHPLTATVFWDYPNVDALSQYLAGLGETETTAPPPPATGETP